MYMSSLRKASCSHRTACSRGSLPTLPDHASHAFVHFAISPIGPETAVMSSLSSLAPSRSRRAVLLQPSTAKSIPDTMNYTPHTRRARGCLFQK